MSQKIFDNYLVVIQTSKITLTCNKSAYFAIYILDLRNVLMYEFHYDYIKSKYGNNSRLLFTNTDSFIYETKLKVFMKIFVKAKKCLTY